MGVSLSAALRTKERVSLIDLLDQSGPVRIGLPAWRRSLFSHGAIFHDGFIRRWRGGGGLRGLALRAVAAAAVRIPTELFPWITSISRGGPHVSPKFKVGSGPKQQTPLRGLVGDVLGYFRYEVERVEQLEVPACPARQALVSELREGKASGLFRFVDDLAVVGGFDHAVEAERAADDVLGQPLDGGGVAGLDPDALVHAEAGVALGKGQ